MGLDLVTLQQYKSHSGILSGDQDAVISSMIPKVSALVKSICRRSFLDYVDDAKTELFRGGDAFILTEGPLIAVSSVEVSLDYGATYTALTEYTDYVVDLITEQVLPINSLGTFKSYINGYKVTYTAGYETLPQDLIIAILDLVNYYVRNDSAIHSHKAIGSNTVQIEYITNTNLPAHIKRVLDLYSANYN